MRGVEGDSFLSRVVLDTNILVSALFWEGNEREILRKCRAGDLCSITSPQILEELEHVLLRKFEDPK
ncbi:MAG: putative toxin-antitoxin system toxin component, PIN family [Thermoplasmata archaeon]